MLTGCLQYNTITRKKQSLSAAMIRLYDIPFYIITEKTKAFFKKLLQFMYKARK